MSPNRLLAPSELQGIDTGQPGNPAPTIIVPGANVQLVSEQNDIELTSARDTVVTSIRNTAVSSGVDTTVSSGSDTHVSSSRDIVVASDRNTVFTAGSQFQVQATDEVTIVGCNGTFP